MVSVRLTVGQFIREQLASAGDTGTTQADLFRAWKETGPPRRPRYASFRTHIVVAKLLGYVEATGRTEPSSNPNMSDRVYYRLSDTGRAASESDWINLQATRYPDSIGEGRWRRWYTPTGRPRGRPRKAVGQVREVIVEPVVVEPVVIEPTAKPVPSRRIRMTPVERLRVRLRDIAPVVEGLRSRFATPEEIEQLESAFESVADDAIDMSSSREERDLDEDPELEEIIERLANVSEALEDMREGALEGMWVTYLRGYEIVRTCCE